MVSLSTTTNITCKYTAFVGVDKHSKEIVAKGIYLFDIQIQEFEGTKFLELQIGKLKTGISSKKIKDDLLQLNLRPLPPYEIFFLYFEHLKKLFDL